MALPAWAVVVIVFAVLLLAGAGCFFIARRHHKHVLADMDKLESLVSTSGYRKFEPGKTLPYIIHHNHFMGGWLLVADVLQGRFRSYDVFDVKLHSVDVAFSGKLQGWNRDYRAARMIYSDSPGAAVARGAIHAEHNALYREKGVHRTTKGELTSPGSLIALIRAGLRDGSQTFFTYVILPDGTWRFSTTGKEKLRDGLSKHAVHANAAPELSYAGEFHFDLDTRTLILDNNSGTFAPDKADLDKVRVLFELNFPQLNVECLDREHPTIKAAHAEIYDRGSRKITGEDLSQALSGAQSQSPGSKKGAKEVTINVGDGSDRAPAAPPLPRDLEAAGGGTSVSASPTTKSFRSAGPAPDSPTGWYVNRPGTGTTAFTGTATHATTLSGVGSMSINGRGGPGMVASPVASASFNTPLNQLEPRLFEPCPPAAGSPSPHAHGLTRTPSGSTAGHSRSVKSMSHSRAKRGMMMI